MALRSMVWGHNDTKATIPRLINVFYAIILFTNECHGDCCLSCHARGMSSSYFVPRHLQAPRATPTPTPALLPTPHHGAPIESTCVGILCYFQAVSDLYTWLNQSH
jgi:hypothetical protein